MKRSSRVLVIVGAALLASGLVLGAASGLKLATTFGSNVFALFTADVYRTPMSTEFNLHEGSYVVYELTGTKNSVGPLTTRTGRGVTISVEDVRVTSSSGESLSVEPSGMDETVTRGSAVYTAAVKFDVPHDGQYLVVIAQPGGHVFVAPSITNDLPEALVWGALGALSGLMLLGGAILLILGLFYRPRQPVRAPAGWYADPHRQANWRWWDGKIWTDRTG